MEVLSYRHLEPNALGIKLGTALYGREASEMGKTQMLWTVKATTFFETCVQLTGFRASNTKGLALGGFFRRKSSVFM